MKCFVTIITIATSVIKGFGENNINNDRFFVFPGDGDETLHLVDVQELVDEHFLQEYVRNPKNNAYWLFTRANPTVRQILVPGDVKSINDSNINFCKKVVILAHGWYGHGGNLMSRMLTEAFLQDKDINVIVLDWSTLAGKNYVTAKRGTPAAGRALGEFVKWIVSLGASYDKMHLIGFSLGAHLIGSAGRETGAMVKRITGLDPAGPLWSRDEERISTTDAQYVEVIHTNTGFYGFSDICGDADFFPNGGSSMPGCWLNACSHSRAYEYMATSVINNHFLANECDSLKDMTKNNCSRSVYHMGNSDLSKTRPGIFRVNTAKYYPF